MTIGLMMKKNGYFGVGCLNMKTSMNYGTLFRTAQVFGADFIFLIGSRFKHQASDTMKSWRHIPVFIYKDFADFQSHRPKQACYLLGSEDNGLSKEALAACQEVVYLPWDRSLNVSVAGSIVLYDRISKNV